MNDTATIPREPGPGSPPTTRAAEGLARRAWTLDDVHRMLAAGILGERERFELIGGEIVPMSPKGIRHEVLKAELQQFWIPRVVGSSTNLITETTLYISDTQHLEPDFIFWPRAIPLAEVKPGVLSLLVEVADSSLLYDTGRKATIYAGLGVAEYWVVNAVSLATVIHREPGPEGYADVAEHLATARLVPQRLPELAVTLADLGDR